MKLNDDDIGRIWFESKIPGLTETDARRLIRKSEALMRERMLNLLDLWHERANGEHNYYQNLKNVLNK
jgi:hypothetical protein